MAVTENAQSRKKRLYSIPEAGEYLGRTPWAVRHLIWDGILPSVRIGRRVQVDISDLDLLIERNKTTVH
jgi:excisionase family DNA binding protein